VACALALVLANGVGQPAAAQGAGGNPFAGAKSWAYQLKNLGEKQRKDIADSAYDLVVVDYARSLDTDTEAEVPLTREQVAAMQKKPDGSKRIVIAYLSIGESENYRYYWKPEWNKKRPDWMGGESKEWEGNYLVKYWHPTWQKIIYGNPESYVDRILAQGFDGFYIDRSDAYYRFGDSKQARDQMAELIVNISKYIRSKKPDAGIMIQNAEELLDRPPVIAAIDAIAKEDLVYGITHREERNKQDDIDWSNKLLKSAQERGKRIFVVEYLTKPVYIAAAKEFMTNNDYVLYYGPRGLFEINAGAAREKAAPDLPPAYLKAKEKAAAKAKAGAKAGAKAK
jgi:cysteinyl-tRNA synthetase